MKIHLLKELYRTVLIFTLLFAASNSLSVSLVNAQSSVNNEKQDEKKQISQDNVELTLNKPIERELAGNEAHSYKIALTAGQYLHVVLEQKGIDVVVALFAPDGKKVAEIDSPNGTDGDEPLYFVAETAGNYRFEVRSPDAEAKAGRYEAKIVELNVATPENRKQAVAAKLNADALSKLLDGSIESLREALTIYQKSLQLWKELGNFAMETDTLDTIGTIYSNIGEKQKALEYYNLALIVSRKLTSRAKEATILSNLGVIYSDLGDNQKALNLYQQTLVIQKELGELRGQEITLNNIGIVYNDLGEKQKAIDYYIQSLELTEDDRGRATTLNNIGIVYMDLGENQKAIDFYNQAVLIRREAVDERGESQTLNNIGRFYSELGEPEKALDYYNQSLLLRRKIGNKRGEAITLLNIGVVYIDLGEIQKAIDYFKLALPLQKEVGNPQGEASTLNGLCVAYKKLGNYENAMELCNQALNLFRAAGDRLNEANVLNNLGNVYDDSGKKEKVLDYYNQALIFARAVGDRQEEILILYNIARYERNIGNLDSARTHCEAGLKIIESIRKNIVSADLRASYFASLQDFYKFYIDLLMQLHKRQPTKGYDAKALQVGERARARSLLETLTEANANIREGVDPKLLQRERDLQQLIAGKSERLTRISNDEKLKDQKAAAEKEVSDLLSQYQEVESEIRVKSPRYAALTQPVPADLAEIQKLLDKDTVLLEYSLGEERSYLWLVTPQSLKSYELPKRGRIEELADQFVAGVTGQNNVPTSDEINYQKRQVFIDKAKANYPPVSAELGRILLGQIAPEIKDKRLLIVGDGILQYVPFAALPFADSKLQIPNSKTAVKSGIKYLVKTNEIVNLPSASTLAILRGEENERGGREYTKTAAVFADPVFDAGDIRVANAEKNVKLSNKITASRGQTNDALSADTENIALRSAKEVGLANRGGLARLTESSSEAKAIQNAATAGQTTVSLGFDASRERVLTSDFDEYRIVHFATHGLLNEEHPELSGVVLSLIDEQGKPQNGFLRLNDIYNLKLPVEMVVLSACQTGLGKNVRGEGLIGLTRGFMYAGAPRVVATLWSVDDEATKELMQIFYQKMLGEKLSPATALRSAQMEMSGRERWKSPVYWAGFILQGEWRNIAPDKK